MLTQLAKLLDQAYPVFVVGIVLFGAYVLFQMRESILTSTTAAITAKKAVPGKLGRWLLSRAVGTAAFMGPAVLILALSAALGLVDAGIVLAGTWIAGYLLWNVGIVKQQDWQVIERFGQYYTVKFAGIRLYCMRGLVDMIKAKGDFKDHSHALFCDSSVPGKIEKLDFKDTSASVDAKLWYHVGRKSGTKAELMQDIFNYVYRADSPDAQAVEITEDHLRPKLQVLKIDEVSESRKELANGVQAEVSADIAPLGLYLQEQAPILIADIDLPEEVRLMREERLRGQTEADALTKVGAGYRRSIEAIMKADGAEGEPMFSADRAAQIWENQQTRDMLAKTGANITIIAPSADGILKTLNVTP